MIGYRISKAGKNMIVRYSDGDMFKVQAYSEGYTETTFIGADGYNFRRFLRGDKTEVSAYENGKMIRPICE